MKDTNYAFCVARIRALENKLLTKQDISTLISQKDYQSAIRFLSDKGYICENYEIESIIRAEEEKLTGELLESVPDKKELESLYIVNDFFNLKALVKCLFEHVDPYAKFVYPTTVSLNIRTDASPEEIFKCLNEPYRSVITEAYRYTLQNRNGKYCDTIIDKAAIDSLADLFKNKKSGLCGKIAAILADTANIKIAFRCISSDQNKEFISEAIGRCCEIDKNKLIDCTVKGCDELRAYLMTTVYKEGVDVYLNGMADFEKWCDNRIITETKKSVYTSFGFDPVVSYYYRKKLEIKTVRMILNAIKSDVNKQLIIERVRDIYA